MSPVNSILGLTSVVVQREQHQRDIHVWADHKYRPPCLYCRQGRRFKTLQDRFRQLSLIGATDETGQVEADFEALMQRMDDARASNPTIPERHFAKAQRKIKNGAYGFDSTKAV